MSKIISLLKKILLWLLASFFAMASITYLPGLAGICAVLVVILIVPIQKWQYIISKIINSKVKVIIIVIFIVLTFATAPAQESSNTNDAAIMETEKQVEIMAEPTTHPTVEPTAVPTSEATSMPTVIPEESEPEKESDWEIIMRAGHPRYYGSTSEAHQIWQGVAKEKIVYADSYHDYSDETILLMTGYSREEKNEIIRRVEIYLENFEEPMTISLEEAIQLADGYMPYDIIAEWYEFEHSYCIKSKDGQDDTCYVVEYGLTDEASDAYYADEHTYSGRITVIFYTDSTTGNVKIISIGFGTPKWMNFLERNGYEKTEWVFDFTA